MNRTAALIVVSVSLVGGCHSVKWEDWEYARIDQMPLQRAVTLDSSPSGAEVVFDDRIVGHTPLTIDVPYTETAAVFERKQIERDGLDKRVLQVETERRNVTVNATAHTVTFSRPHYHDAVATIRLPGQTTVRSTLERVPYDWQYKRTDDRVPRKQAIQIESNPPGATVFVGDQPIGTTPLQYQFDYSIEELVFEKIIVEEQQGPAPRVRTESKRQTGGLSAVPYELTFKLPRYHDHHAVLTVPATEIRFGVELLQVTGIYDIACTVKITAREEYFSAIETVIRSHAVPGPDGTPLLDKVASEGDASALRSLGIAEESYELLVKDLQEFGRLVSRLQALAKKHDFVFHITNALLSADFDTNVMQGEMEHTIIGRSRPGSFLYLVPGPGKSGELAPIPVDEKTATYERKVRLQPGETDVFLLSIYIPPNNRYAPPLAVFLKVNVHTQNQTELSREEFEKATGREFSEERIRALVQR